MRANVSCQPAFLAPRASGSTSQRQACPSEETEQAKVFDSFEQTNCSISPQLLCPTPAHLGATLQAEDQLRRKLQVLSAAHLVGAIQTRRQLGNAEGLRKKRTNNQHLHLLSPTPVIPCLGVSQDTKDQCPHPPAMSKSEVTATVAWVASCLTGTFKLFA